MRPWREDGRDPASGARGWRGKLQADPKSAMVIPRANAQTRAVLLGNSRDYRQAQTRTLADRTRGTVKALTDATELLL